MKNLISYKIPGGELTGIDGMPTHGYGDFQAFVPWLMTIIFIGVSLVCLVLLISGGIQWITSGGDKHGIEGARNRIVYAIIGLVIIFFSYLIITTVGDFFGLKLLNIPSKTQTCGGATFGTCSNGQVCRGSSGRYYCGCNPHTAGCAF